MSHVTNLILTTLDVPEEALPVLADIGFRRVDELAGGDKHMECTVWLCALNYPVVQDICEKLKAIAWAWPECVQLFVRDQHDEGFTQVFFA